jgi:NAD(P)-dependent dehydrogenase (short-subunit alcohol dehydrogenase family)
MNSNLFDLKDKVVLITGGYGYLGRSICRSLADFNAIVYVLGRDDEKFENSFKGSNDKIIFNRCDISDSASIRNSFAEIASVTGRIDVLINNAFYLKGQDPEGISDEDWMFSMEGSLNSVYKCIREVIPYLKKNKSGKIINVSSMYGVVAPNFDVYEDHSRFLNPPHYGAAKAGVLQLTKYFAAYLGKYNINVNAVSPGPFPSDDTQKEVGFIKKLEKKNPLNRIGRPEDLAGAFLLLSSEASNYITGHNLVVDGGWTIW